MKPLYLVTFLCFIWLGDALPQVGDLPAGLKPAKAFGAFEQAIVPGTEEVKIFNFRRVNNSDSTLSPKKWTPLF
jgi:hypothetical protein